MTLIEGIGDEVTQFFLALLVIGIVTLGWWTTSISEQRHVQTVWLLDRRRHRPHRRLTNHTHAVTITEGVATSTSGDPPSTAPDELEAVASAEALTKPPEAGTSGDRCETNPIEERNEEEEEQTRILEAMDADTCELRQRRLAFYNRTGGQAVDAAASPSEPSGVSAVASEPNPSPADVIMEHNYAERTVESDTHVETHGNPPQDNQQRHTAEAATPESPAGEAERNASGITIRLKYINDDLKLVDGRLQEQLGDFKKRHFQGEMSSNKLVRLIFNGQVLQQDTKTLQGCGLFDNCVVHCLIHQRRTAPGEDGATEGSGDHINLSSLNANTHHLNNNNQGRDWDLGNFLFALISFSLLSAWYFRYVYAHLYTVTATVGLILMTGVFTIVLFGFYFPDQEQQQIPQVAPEPNTQPLPS